MENRAETIVLVRKIKRRQAEKNQYARKDNNNGMITQSDNNNNITIDNETKVTQWNNWLNTKTEYEEEWYHHDP